MLGIQKISMAYTNHPYCLMMIREDPTLDEEDARAESAAGGLGALTGGLLDAPAGGEAPAATEE